jgi:TPP-dependent 2-oxoacid decarboxylase
MFPTSCDASSLARSLDLEINNNELEDLENVIIGDILSMVTNAKRPTVLVDVLAHRYGALKYIHTLLEQTRYPVSDLHTFASCDRRANN